MQAAISYLRSPAPFTSWTADARMVYFDKDVIGNPSTGAVGVVPGSSAWGNFDFWDVSLRCFGASSALAASWFQDGDFYSQQYWMAWSDTIGVYCEPGWVDGSFGYTEQ